MDEKIKELAKEHLVRDEYTEQGWQECHKYEFNSAELEKFAELIVKECASVGYDASYYECALHVSNKIKEHFGIGEMK